MYLSAEKPSGKGYSTFYKVFVTYDKGFFLKNF